MNKLKLYEIPGAFRAIDALLDESGGELTVEVENALAAVEASLKDRVDAVCALIRESLLDADVVSVEVERLQARVRSSRRKAERLKDYLARVLAELGKDKVKGDRFSVSVCKNGAPSVRWDSGDPIPTVFRKVEVSLDSAKAHAVLKAGGTLPEGFRVDYGKHVRIS